MKNHYRITSITNKLFFCILAGFILISVNLSAQAPYCSPQFSTGCSVGDQIESFSTAGGITNISNLSSGCSQNNYSFINNQSVTVESLGGFEFTVQSGTWSQGFRIWIDWNDDGDYNDPGEDMWNSGAAGTSFTDSIFAPVGVAGTFRMRVRCDFFSVPTDPCAQQTYGEVEEYLVEVLPGAPDDAGIESIDKPESYVYCDTPEDVEVTVRNFGSDVLNTGQVHWVVDGDTMPPYTFVGPIDTIGGNNPITASYVIGSYTFPQTGNYEIVAWTENPNGVPDTVNYNDTMRKTVSVKLMDLELVSTTGVRCNGQNDGSRIVVKSSAVNAQYYWSQIGLAEDTITGIPAGTYSVTVTGDFSCPETLTGIQITEPPLLEFNVTDESTVSCNGNNDAFAEVQATGGVPPYDYFWFDGTSGNRIDDLGAGTYGLTITDDTGCVESTVLEINEPQKLVLDIDQSQNVQCFGENSGVVSLSGQGGTTPYHFNWNTGDTADFKDDLTGGQNYNVTLTDDNGCSDAVSFFIAQPDPLDNRIEYHNSGLRARMDWHGTEYAWLNCDNGNIVTGESGRRFVPEEESGNYAAIVTYQGCSDTTDCLDMAFVSTQDRAGEAVEFNLYPNPNTGVFNVTLKGNLDSEVQMQLLDAQGKMLMDRSIGNLNGELNEQVNLDLAQGMYFMKIVTESSTEIKRFVVK